MGVNSDDGFRMTVGGATPIDKFAPVVGEFNGGRGASDTLFTFSVAQAGLHAVRFTWEQGGGGANLEIFTVKANGDRVLVNDTANGGVRAYRAVTTPARAYARKVSPAPNSTNAGALATILVELVDGATPILSTSAALSLDGIAVPVAAYKVGNVTTVTCTPATYFDAGSHHSMLFSYKENGATIKVPWTFTVVYDIGPNGHSYEVVLVENGITWPEAKAAAESKGTGGTVSHLATITTYEEISSSRHCASRQSPIARTASSGSADFKTRILRTTLNPMAAGSGLTGKVRSVGIIGAILTGLTPNWQSSPYFQPDNAYVNEGASEDYLAIGLGNSFGWNDDGYFAGGRRNGTLGGYIVEYEPIPLLVDIKPDDSKNAVNLLSNGKLPVAVLSTAAFKANQLDASSVRFGRTGMEAAPVSTSLQDVNGDGKKDLLLHFNIQDTGLLGDDRQAVLTARTLAHRPASGRDTIQVIDSPHYSLTAKALQDVKKVTDLELVVQPLKSGAITPAIASKLQLKSFDIVGQLRWTKNLPKYTAPAARTQLQYRQCPGARCITSPADQAEYVGAVQRGTQH
jgi:hypothetical protein